MPILIYSFSIRGELIITTHRERQQDQTRLPELWNQPKRAAETGYVSLSKDVIVVPVLYNTAES